MVVLYWSVWTGNQPTGSAVKVTGLWPMPDLIPKVLQHERFDIFFPSSALNR
jgi:hypothetical protein